MRVCYSYTGLNHYRTLQVPQSSYISSLRFLQQGVKSLPFWPNASLTEDKSASIPPPPPPPHRLGTGRPRKRWGSHVHVRTGREFPWRRRKRRAFSDSERARCGCTSASGDETSGVHGWSCALACAKVVYILFYMFFFCFFFDFTLSFGLEIEFSLLLTRFYPHFNKERQWKSSIYLSIYIKICMYRYTGPSK